MSNLKDNKPITTGDRVHAAIETQEISNRGTYTLPGVPGEEPKTIQIPGKERLREVEYIPANAGGPVPCPLQPGDGPTYILANMDSFQAAQYFFDNPSAVAVQSFASPSPVGGGFLTGARAQEASLCRESTLFESISTRTAEDAFYRRNAQIEGAFVPDDMLYSPYVVVFRDNTLELLPEPFVTTVLTVPTPNCSTSGRAKNAPADEIRSHMKARLETMFRTAHERGIHALVLGAWGCGAYRINPRMISELYRELLVDDGWGACFDTIVFAIRGNSNDTNFRTFQSTLESVLGDNVYTDTVPPAYVR